MPCIDRLFQHVGICFDVSDVGSKFWNSPTADIPLSTVDDNRVNCTHRPLRLASRHIDSAALYVGPAINAIVRRAILAWWDRVFVVTVGIAFNDVISAFISSEDLVRERPTAPDARPPANQANIHGVGIWNADLCVLVLQGALSVNILSDGESIG